ncbi:carboxypeptidase-like regulatory domain-containing protein [Adhaeribacter sp. BT258]|uniref:Carboxypeptidase-like regulatory domain-containing protein n=1 Tax=Adhaeribacter terrigena TaxID=2793070 RepID=A0ABS1C2S2_9BACT|nr:carboxypeptidase-like regulatory domain-containing protein [Adhaeribacter terrigena]MBK0403684.1 carboxypeptidase-like regulatory domain-containing protein [Adhaeribacter terrigena]
MPVLKRSAFWGLLSFLLLAGQVAYGQKVTLNGRVLDAKTALPVESVSIQLNDSGETAVTNASGSFSMQIDTVSAPPILTFSHLGYEKFTLQLKSGQTKITVNLTPKTSTLSEVKITASKKLKPAKVRPETVLDFAISQNQLFVLGWETGQKNPSLQILNLYNDSLIMNCRLPVTAEKLFVDCLENLHVLTENFVYQVLSDSASLALYPPEPKAAFEQYLRPCLTTDEKNAYFRQNINKGIIVSFYAVNQQTHETRLFRTVVDEAVITMQKEEKYYQKSKMLSGMYRTPRSAANNALFARQVMFEAPYVPLVKIGKQICLFDHVNGEISFYENDSLRRVLPVNYHLQPNWDKQIVVDKAQERTYVLFRKNGLPELKLLNLQTGELLNSYKLTNPFAGNISVHNGQVYFLYKDPAKNDRQFLYKSPLSPLQN